jgi:hypothetical protein
VSDQTEATTQACMYEHCHLHFFGILFPFYFETIPAHLLLEIAVCTYRHNFGALQIDN